MADVDHTDAQGLSPAGREDGGGDNTDAGRFAKLFGLGKEDKQSKGEGNGPAKMDAQDAPVVVPPLTESQYVYNMTHDRRGKAIIINNRTFLPVTKMTERNGTDVDASNLEVVLAHLGFDVTRHDNVTVRNMSKILHTASREDYSNVDCFACAILSHGDTGIVYGVDGIIQLDTLTESFKGDKCPSLAGKPKLFFIQACRGTKLDHGVEVADDGEEADSGPQKIPAEADFLMAYSVVPGFFSWRNSTKGSWFIQALCKVLAQYGQTHEILWMMTRVNRMVAYEFESNAAQQYMTGKKQIPCIVSMLTKELYFKPKSS